MKQKLIKLLCTGCIETKKYKALDFHKKFGFTTLIIKNAGNDCISCNNNAFWQYSNNDKRTELIDDLIKVKRCNIKDPIYFHILNRIENGDKYGMIAATPTNNNEDDDTATIEQKQSENDYLEYRFNETLESEQFDDFIVLCQSYDLVNLKTGESKEVFNVAIETMIDDTFSKTIDLFESYNQCEVDIFYDNLIRNIKKVGKLKW